LDGGIGGAGSGSAPGLDRQLGCQQWVSRLTRFGGDGQRLGLRQARLKYGFGGAICGLNFPGAGQVGVGDSHGFLGFGFGAGRRFGDQGDSRLGQIVAGLPGKTRRQKRGGDSQRRQRRQPNHGQPPVAGVGPAAGDAGVDKRPALLAQPCQPALGQLLLDQRQPAAAVEVAVIATVVVPLSGRVGDVVLQPDVLPVLVYQPPQPRPGVDQLLVGDGHHGLARQQRFGPRLACPAGGDQPGVGLGQLGHRRRHQCPVAPGRHQLLEGRRPPRVQPPLPGLDQPREDAAGQGLLLVTEPGEDRVGVALQRALDAAALDVLGQRQVHRPAGGRLLGREQVLQGEAHQRQRPRLALHVVDNPFHQRRVDVGAGLQRGQGDGLAQVARLHRPHQLELPAHQPPQFRVGGAVGDEVGAQGDEDDRPAARRGGGRGQLRDDGRAGRLVAGLGEDLFELVDQQDEALVGVVGQQHLDALVQRPRVGLALPADMVARARPARRPVDGRGQVLARIAARPRGRQQPRLALGQAVVAQGVEQPGTGHRRLAAARWPGQDDERLLPDPGQQVIDEAFAAEEELGVALLERLEAEVGGAAVPDYGLILVLQLDDQRRYLLNGQALIGRSARADGDDGVGDVAGGDVGRAGVAAFLSRHVCSFGLIGWRGRVWCGRIRGLGRRRGVDARRRPRADGDDGATDVADLDVVAAAVRRRDGRGGHHLGQGRPGDVRPGALQLFEQVGRAAVASGVEKQLADLGSPSLPAQVVIVDAQLKAELTKLLSIKMISDEGQHVNRPTGKL